MPKNRGGEKGEAQGRISFKADLLDEVLKGYRGPEDFEEIFKQFKEAVGKRALGAELAAHLGYKKGEDKPKDQSNQPQDRESSFEPQLIKKGSGALADSMTGSLPCIRGG